MDQQQPPPNGRFMQVKVLYTFNDDPKSNCLARCPQSLIIRTAYIDDSTEIGVIELRTCIQAIASASPELVAKLGQDYTVYAYDYSEYETPLVGQGMLSYILAATSTTPTAPAHQSRTLVTGKVSKNKFALFSSGVTETLEVKLKLIPVPSGLQSVYLENMEKYRSPSTLEGATVYRNDAVATAAFQSFMPGPTQSPSPVLSHTGPHSPAFTRQWTGNEVTIAQPRPQHFAPTHNTLHTHAPAPISRSVSQKAARPSTPLQNCSDVMAASQFVQKRPAEISRPSSRASNAGAAYRPMLTKTQSCASRVEHTSAADTSEAEDGPRPKRARVTQTDWNGSMNFGAAGDLRVAAATSASIRGHRPYAAHALTSDIAAAESGDRPPTPRPGAKKPARSTKRPSILSGTTFPPNLTGRIPKSPEVSYHPLSNHHDPLGILDESSPEKNDDSSTFDTPMDLPSSPPIPRSRSISPGQPTEMEDTFNDSGFASGGFDDFPFPRDDDNDCQMNDKEYDQTFADILSGAADEPDRSDIPIPTTAVADAPPAERKIAPAPPGYVAPSSPILAPRKRAAPKSRTQSTSRAAKPRIVSEDQDSGPLSAAISDDTRMRSESCMTDSGSVAGDNVPGIRRHKSQSQEKKKLAAQQRLLDAVAAGELPRFCKNCGEISTAVWRLAFVKVVQGAPPEGMQAADPEKKLVGYEALEHDDDGIITRYRFSKLQLEEGDVGFDEIELCNPCGLWLSRNKIMRPMEACQEKEKKKPAAPKPRQKSAASKKKATASDASQSDGLQSDGATQSIERDVDSTSPANATALGATKTTKRPGAAARLQRASSAGPMNHPVRKSVKGAASQLALQRAIQSSPPRFPGSKHSPIEVDLELSPDKPTKRLLFPSPRKAGQLKSLDPEAERSQSGSQHGQAVDGFTIIDDFDDDRNVTADNQAAPGGANFASLDSLPGSMPPGLTTPQRPINSALNNSKTPNRSSRRTPLGSSRAGASAGGGRGRAHSNPATPSRSMLPHTGTPEMTPWTKHLFDSLTSDANPENNGMTHWNGLDDANNFFNFSDFSENGLGGFDQAGGTAGDGMGFWPGDDMQTFIHTQPVDATDEQSPFGTVEDGAMHEN